jgi:hypothetical protein
LDTVGYQAKALGEKLYVDRFEEQKRLVEELKVEWKLMWSERFNDKARAEGVSVADYGSLFVDRGTIIHATRDFKALSFREILDRHLVLQPDRFVQPDSAVGGWGKFIKTSINKNACSSRRVGFEVCVKKGSGVQQLKKGGRGWLHSV